MSEEEKKAIEKLKEYALCKVNDNGYVEVSANGYKHTILNLIENQQKELNNLKEIEQAHKTDNGLLRQELDMQIEHNKELDNILYAKQSMIDELTQNEEKLKIELGKEKEKNKDLEEKLKIAVAMLTKGTYPEKNEGDNDFDKKFIAVDKIKEIVDEHIPKQPNIITGEMEYTPNTNANSFLVQDILKLLEEK